MVLSARIPAQLSEAEFQELVELETSVESGMDFLAGGNLILNIFLSFGLKFLWNFVNLL